VPTQRPGIRSVLFTFLVLLFGWLPVLSLYGAALWSALKIEPAALSQLLSLGTAQQQLFFNTVVLGALTAFFALLFGAPVGVAMCRAPRRWRTLFTVLCALPLAVPPIVLATTWLEITRTPPARSLAALAATRSAEVSPLLLSALVLALSFFPIVAFALRAALLSLPASWEEAARGLGGARQTWNRVLIPLIAPPVVAALGAVFLLSMWEMGAPDLLDARTYSVEIYRDLAAPNSLDAAGKDARAALASLPMFALGAVVMWRCCTHYDETDKHSSRVENPNVFGAESRA
jgi:ABC-type Fe3+ transport system permease subunit